MPSWPRITIHVEPQITVKMAKGIATERSTRSFTLLSQGGERGGEPIDGLGVRIPAGDEADLARAPLIEVRALGAEARRFLIGRAQEQLVGFDGINEPS